MNFLKRLICGTIVMLLLPTAALAQSSFPLSQPNHYNHISANGNTSSKSGPGVFSVLCINKKGATANTITVYDGTDNTGTVIAIFDTTTSFGCFNYNIAFTVGLFIVTASGTAADATVGWQ